MLRKLIFLILSLSVLLVFSCGGKKDNAAVSMEQLQAENGQPVSVRKLETGDFSVFLKYPALINASSESTAYAGLDDVVRTISARVGETVKQNDVIVSFSPDNRILRQAVLANDNARTAYERTGNLFRSNDISRQDFDSVTMQYEMSQTNLKAANDMIYVKAPISGTITQINVRVTENVRPGTALFTVSNSNAFQAKLYVGADEIGRIQVGARAFIDLSRGKDGGQSIDGEKSIEGRITQVSLIMDSQKQAFPVTVVFDSGNRNLVSGINVDVSVETYRNEEALVVTRQELVQTGTGPAVFVVDNPASAVPRLREVAVHTGEEKGLSVEISGGLNAGDTIVSEGAQRLAPDSKIAIVPAILAGVR